MDCNAQPAPDDHGVTPALGDSWRQCAITKDASGLPLRWQDPDRIMHAVELWPTVPGSHEATGNTRCGVYDLPPEEGWAGKDHLTCNTCAELEHEDRTVDTGADVNA